MALHLTSHRFGVALLATTLGSFVACGGDSDDPDRSDGSAGRTGEGASGNDGGSSNGTGGSNASGPGFPSELPADTNECASASGSDGCYYDGCCAELVACAENDDCKTVYDCYVACGADTSNCFVNCASSSLQAGGDDFGAAIACLAPLTLSCGAPSGGSGGSGGSGNGEGGSGGTDSTDAGPLGSATDALGWNLEVSDDPLVAELEPDTDRAVSEEITADGGTITATAEDGTTFELEIPEGAVYGPTLITLTPLASLEVPPLEGDAYGVQIEPDGLELMGSPTLRITPPDGEEWPIDQQIPLAISGSDQTVSLSLLEPESETLELVLTHFSSYGALLSKKGLGATLSEGEIRSRFAGDVESRLQSAAAERLGRERQKQLLGSEDDSELPSLIAELFPEYEEHVIKPRVAKAGESCAAGKFAIQTVLGFERQKQLLGVEDTSAEWPIIPLLPVVADVCLKEEYELCRDNHIITRVLPVLFSFMRQSQLLGLGTEIEGVSIPPPWVLQAENYAHMCLKFELQFDSDVLYSDVDFSMNETVTARVPFELTASLTTLPTDSLPPGSQESGALISGGPAPLESTTYAAHTDEECRTIDDELPEDGELYVSFMGFTPGITTEETPGGSPEVLDFGVSLALVPNLSKYAFTQQRVEEAGCSEVIVSGEEIMSWSSSLGSYMMGEHAAGENGAWFDAWEVQHEGGHILAVKDMSLNGSDGSSTYRGPVNMVLIHTPDP